MAKGGGQPPQQPSSGGGDHSTNFVWMIAAVVIGVGLIWYFGHAYIVIAIFKLRLFEINFIEFVLSLAEKLLALLGFKVNFGISLEGWRQFIAQNSANVATLPFSEVIDLSTGVGRYLIYPASSIALLMAVNLFVTNVGSKYKTVFNMKQLRDLESLNWPQLNPLMKTNLVKVPLDEGPWAMSIQPLAFVRKHKLVEEITRRNRPALKLIPGRAHHVFSLQLGPYWDGLEKMPKYMQALFAIFAAHGNNDVDSAQKMLRQISLSAKPGNKLNFSGVRALLVKHVRQRSIGRVVGMHAYVYTIMISMLELARTGGVVSSADFLWLKPLDRRLWYVLSNTGRQTAFCEVAGVFAHWLVERRLRRPLKTPMVNEAVIALDTAINEFKLPD